MNARILVVAVVLTAASWPSYARAQRAVFLVRHAEKKDASADPPLSAKGKVQAAALALRLEDAGVSAVYTSQFVRTQRTAKPLKDALTAAGLTVKDESIPLSPGLLAAPTDAARLDEYGKSVVKHLHDHHPDEIVLIVGHDNTVPAIIKALGHAGPVVIAPTEFDRLFLVIPRPPGEARPPGLLRMRHY